MHYAGADEDMGGEEQWWGLIYNLEARGEYGYRSSTDIIYFKEYSCHKSQFSEDVLCRDLTFSFTTTTMAMVTQLWTYHPPPTGSSESLLLSPFDHEHGPSNYNYFPDGYYDPPQQEWKNTPSTNWYNVNNSEHMTGTAAFHVSVATVVTDVFQKKWILNAKEIS